MTATSPGNANLPIGATSDPGSLPAGGTATRQSGDWRAQGGVPGGFGEAGWHSRGYLPHFDGVEVTQHVTFHLADSLPTSVVKRLEDETRCLPPEQQEVERRKRVEAWIDSGHGSCILREPVVAAMVQDALCFFDGQRYRLFAWVVMPNHVHVLFQPINDWPVAKTVASWKKCTATHVCAFRRSSSFGNAGPGNANLLIGVSNSASSAVGRVGVRANREIGVPGGDPAMPVWHREYWDRFIRNEHHFHQAVEYIHQNPVKAGLVAMADAWPWGSAFAGRKCAVPERSSPGMSPPGTPIS